MVELYRRDNPSTPEHPHLVACSAKSESDLVKIRTRLESQGVRVTSFREPDLGDRLTALAAGPVSGSARSPFRRLRLLTAADLAGDMVPQAEPLSV